MAYIVLPCLGPGGYLLLLPDCMLQGAERPLHSRREAAPKPDLSHLHRQPSGFPEPGHRAYNIYYVTLPPASTLHTNCMYDARGMNRPFQTMHAWLIFTYTYDARMADYIHTHPYMRAVACSVDLCLSVLMIWFEGGNTQGLPRFVCQRGGC